jgi:hypothetical protein
MVLVQLDLEKWLVVEALPEATHLCARCKRLAQFAGKTPREEKKSQ